MGKFNAGDLVNVTLEGEGHSLEFNVVSFNVDGTGDLYIATTWPPTEGEIFPLDEFDGRIKIDLVKARDERLPSEPGRYFEVAGPFAEFAEATGLDLLDVIGRKPEDDELWVRNEDGTWTDHQGVTKAANYNWLLAVNTSVFVKFDA